MGLFGTAKKADEKPGATPAGETEATRAPASQVRSAAPPAAGAQAGARVGIDHAIALIRSLPTDKNVDLVVTVLKTTLESLGIRVTDIVQDAAHRQKDIEGRVAQFKSEITALEKEIDQRAEEIVRLEAAHAETTKVREYLERDAGPHVSPAPAKSPPPVPSTPPKTEAAG
jgi:hypothetical protein